MNTGPPLLLILVLLVLLIATGLAAFLPVRTRSARPTALPKPYAGSPPLPPQPAPIAAQPAVVAPAPAKPPTPHDVFISFSSKDKTTADAICAVMERQAIRCFMAPRDIRPGQEWADEILRGISGSRVVVLVFSSAANASPQVRREIERAVHNEIPIIPFRVEDVPLSGSLEYFVSTPHWLDALTPPLEAHALRLADSVRSLLAEPPPTRR
jgi:hypothetical protein